MKTSKVSKYHFKYVLYRCFNSLCLTKQMEEASLKDLLNGQEISP